MGDVVQLRKGTGMGVATRNVGTVTLTGWPCTNMRHYGIGCYVVTLCTGSVVEHHEIRAESVEDAFDVAEKSLGLGKASA